MFKRGETSGHVIERKRAITKSILRKAKLLNEIQSIEEIPEAIKGKSGKVSEVAVHSWHDEKIQVLGYSRNTAYANHNQMALEQLLAAIKKVNNITYRTMPPKGLSNNPLRERIKELEKENNLLRNALAEVYRSYMYIAEKNTEQTSIQLSKQEFISEQAAILGENRLKSIDKND